MEERTAMQQRFRAGELDVARDIASEQIDWLRENMADSLRIAPYAGTYYYVFRCDKEPFTDARIRKAMSRSEEHTSELQSLMRISYAVFCLQQKMNNKMKNSITNTLQRHHF